MALGQGARRSRAARLAAAGSAEEGGMNDEDRIAGLTRRQRSVLAELRSRSRRGQPPPSLGELAAALGLRSRGSLHKQVRALIEAGLVEPMAGRRRGVCLTGAARGGEDRLPLLGRIAAGRPIEALAEDEALEVPGWLRGQGPCYALEVRGDSLREAGILDGDRVVVEQRDWARDGELVVALIDGAEATLKRIEQRPGEVVLHPANAAYAPLRYRPEQVRIQGVVVGLLRSYRGPGGRP